jgi:hypothetical protein
MAVIAQRQRLLQIVGQRLEPAETAPPLIVAKLAQSHRPGPAIVPETENRLREIGGLDRLVEGVSERIDCCFSAIRGRLRAMRHILLWGLRVTSEG